MDLGLRDRKALVFGGSRGMGRATALVLARAGAHVTIAARNLATLQKAAAEIGAQAGIAVTPVVADLTRPDGRDAALAACPDPDILINNADGPAPGDFRDWSRETWIDTLDATMLGPIMMIRAVVDGMIARRFGRIVNISSRSVKSPQWDLGLSNGARSGLIGFIAGLSRQTVKHNVTINNLLPGVFDSDAQVNHVTKLAKITGQSYDELWRERGASNPAGRFGRVDEFGAYCAFLCSAHAGYITGQSLLIDGGAYPGTF